MFYLQREAIGTSNHFVSLFRVFGDGEEDRKITLDLLEWQDREPGTCLQCLVLYVFATLLIHILASSGRIGLVSVRADQISTWRVLVRHRLITNFVVPQQPKQSRRLIGT